MSLISRAVTIGLLTQSLVITAAASTQAKTIDVAIIGPTVDITETHIANFMSNKTVAGFSGEKGGWNFQTNSPVLMSAQQKAFFSEKSKEIARIEELQRQYDASNDRAGFKKALAAEKLSSVYSELTDLGFGTHAASIVARYSKGGDVRIHALVVADDAATQKRIDAAKSKAVSGLKAGQTVFDTEATARNYANYLIAGSSIGSHVANFNKYIKNSGVRIVKSEVYQSGVAIRDDMLTTFKQETKSAPNAEQQKNLDLVFSLAMNDLEAGWCSLPHENPNVLFFFPAGHDRMSKTVAGAGNTDEVPSYPAACARKYPNVLTSTAVDDAGATVAYADYGKSTIEIAGVAKIRGYLPGGTELTMEGTCPIGNALTGVAASIWSKNPTYTVAQVKSAVLALGTPLASLDSLVSTGKFVTRTTLQSFDRY